MAVIGCVCPPKTDGTPRHPNGDTITFRAKLDFRQGLEARNTALIIKQEDPEASVAALLAGLTEVYLLVGIVSWTLADEKGKPVPVTRENVRRFIAEHPEDAMTIGDEADGLYSEAVIAPLVARAQSYSPPTPISGSTSATNGSASGHPKRSRRSSITTTPTDGIERMSASPGGVYS